MDPRDRLRLLPDGATCTACGAPVPGGRIRVLAHRDDVAILELDCVACGSTALGMLFSSAAGGPPVLDVADEPVGRVPEADRPIRPITDADVDAIRRDLAAWDGDLVGWLDTLERDVRPGSVADR
jgi:hypothetical protein